MTSTHPRPTAKLYGLLSLHLLFSLVLVAVVFLALNQTFCSFWLMTGDKPRDKLMLVSAWFQQDPAIDPLHGDVIHKLYFLSAILRDSHGFVV